MAKKPSYKVDLRVDEDFLKKLDIIKVFEKKKRGVGTESHAVRAAVYYYSDKIISGQCG